MNVSQAKSAAVPARGRGRPSAEASAAITETLVEAAHDLFLDQGYAATSLDAVALKAGVPRSTLYKRFADKQALLDAVLARTIALWSSRVIRSPADLPPTLEERLVRYVRNMIVWHNRNEVRAFSAMVMAAQGSSRRSDFSGYANMVRIITEDVEQLSPPAERPRDCRRVAIALMALVAGWLELGEPGYAGEEQAGRDAAWLVSLFLRGRDAW